MTKLLVLEDDPTLQRNIARHLRNGGHEVVVAGTVGEAVDALVSDPDIASAVLDLHLPDGRGFDVLSRLPPTRARPPAIVMTGEATVDSAVHAMRLGVVDYLLKPFSLPALDSALARVFTHVQPRATASEPSPSRGRDWRARFAPEMIGESPVLLRVFDTLERIAATDCPVLVHGETGTGKELVAQALHRASGRGHKPFVAVNCAAVPEALMESELFGHGKGAYTGAVERRVGRFAAADGGTLFLDEIGEMPLALQAKLLRALQEKEITPLGENKPVSVDVRVVAATHRDLDALVETHKFREDLLYRLDVIRLELPPLRDRRDDLPVLVETLIERANERRGTRVRGMEPAVSDALAAFAWPGNVRQLQNVVERAVLMRQSGAITLEDLPEKLHGRRSDPPRTEPGSPALPDAGVDLREAVERFESGLIRQALNRTNWNKNRAAALLKLNRTTLVEKLRKRGWLDEESADATGEDDPPSRATR